MALTDAQIAALRQQLAQAQTQAALPYSDTSRASTASLGTRAGGVSAAQNAAAQANVARIRGLLGPTDAANARAPQDRIDAARTEAYGLARGAVSRVNPLDQMVLQALEERSGKDAGPFDAATRNALMTQASDAASQAMLNQRGRISGSAGDPSVMAANNEADARRQQSIQQAQLGINTQANVANYDARGQALGQLGGYNQQVQGNQTDNERFLMNMLMREQDTQQQSAIGGQIGIPTFTQFSSGRAGQQAPAARAVTPAAPQQTQAVAQPAQRYAPTIGASQNVPLPPTQQQLTTPWNAQNLNPYATQQPQQQVRTVVPNAGTYTNLSNPR